MTVKLGRIFSGIQPSAAAPHLGNYIGAIKPWTQYQHITPLKPILSVVDLHALTNPSLTPSKLRENIFQMTASLLACGLDPQKCVIFQQSMVPHHSELSWILTCGCTLNRLQSLHAWREKLKKLGKGAGLPLGVLMYPVLMASDILLYQTNTVPVGEDQVQHIELARDIASGFNQKFNSHVFNIPEKLIQEESNRIKSLRDPLAKMSKSDDNQFSYVTILDEPDQIQAKVKKAVTDSNPVLTFDSEARPGVSNLINILASLKNLSISDSLQEIESMNTLQLKNLVSDTIVEHLSPIRKEHQRLMNDKAYLCTLLEDGRKEAAEIAERTLKIVKQTIGLI